MEILPVEGGDRMYVTIAVTTKHNPSRFDGAIAFMQLNYGPKTHFKLLYRGGWSGSVATKPGNTKTALAEDIKSMLQQPPENSIVEASASILHPCKSRDMVLLM